MDLFIKNDPLWCFPIKTFNILNPHLSDRNFRTKNIDSVLCTPTNNYIELIRFSESISLILSESRQQDWALEHNICRFPCFALGNCDKIWFTDKTLSTIRLRTQPGQHSNNLPCLHQPEVTIFEAHFVYGEKKEENVFVFLLNANF